MKDKIQTVGVIAMPNISVGGGFARCAADLINALNGMGLKVHVLTPFRLDVKKIESLYCPVKIEKIYYPGKWKRKFTKEDTISRKLMVKEFKEMAKNVDLIIDLDGRVFDKHIPPSFDKSRYFIWRLSCAYPDTKKFPEMRKHFKRWLKEKIKDTLNSPRNYPRRGVTIYALDEWTAKELDYYWHRPTNKILYPPIQVTHIKYKGGKKKKQIAVLGRIAPNKQIKDSIKVFAEGTKGKEEYKLVILGGLTPDSDDYVRELKELASSLGVSSRIEIIGNPTFEKIKEVLLGSSILIDSQRGVSLTMTAIEALAAGCIVLAAENGGTYQEILGKGKYGFGFANVEEGIKNLKEIIKKVEAKKLKPTSFNKRADYFSKENFVKRLGAIVNGY